MPKIELLIKFFEDIKEDLDNLTYWENEKVKNELLTKKIELIKYFLDNFEKWED